MCVRGAGTTTVGVVAATAVVASAAAERFLPSVVDKLTQSAVVFRDARVAKLFRRQSCRRAIATPSKPTTASLHIQTVCPVSYVS